MVVEFTVTAVSLTAVSGGAFRQLTFSAMVKLAAANSEAWIGAGNGSGGADRWGCTHDQPAGMVTDWKVVFGGVVSVMLAAVATLGPVLVITCV